MQFDFPADASFLVLMWQGGWMCPSTALFAVWFNKFYWTVRLKSLWSTNEQKKRHRATPHLATVVTTSHGDQTILEWRGATCQAHRSDTDVPVETPPTTANDPLQHLDWKTSSSLKMTSTSTLQSTDFTIKIKIDSIQLLKAILCLNPSLNYS